MDACYQALGFSRCSAYNKIPLLPVKIYSNETPVHFTGNSEMFRLFLIFPFSGKTFSFRKYKKWPYHHELLEGHQLFALVIAPWIIPLF